MHRALHVVGLLAIATTTAAAQPSGGIKGRVLASESGAPIAGATVSLRSVDDTTVVFTTRASAAGVYRFDVPAGKYDLRATDENRPPGFVRVAIPEASEIEIDVVLGAKSTRLARRRRRFHAPVVPAERWHPSLVASPIDARALMDIPAPRSCPRRAA